MRIDEYVVLEALNIASARYRLGADEYRATAEQVAEVLNTDDRFDRERAAADAPVDAVWVGARLRLLHGSRGRSAPLVERVGPRHWGLTDAALKVLIA